jgi:hypothetical protein
MEVLRDQIRELSSTARAAAAAGSGAQAAAAAAEIEALVAQVEQIDRETGLRPLDYLEGMELG